MQPCLNIDFFYNADDLPFKLN